MPRSLNELIKHADFYAKQFEDYPTGSEDAIDSATFSELWAAGQQKSALENCIESSDSTKSTRICPSFLSGMLEII